MKMDVICKQEKEGHGAWSWPVRRHIVPIAPDSKNKGVLRKLYVSGHLIFARTRLFARFGTNSYKIKRTSDVCDVHLIR